MRIAARFYPAAFYFLYFAALAAFMPFLSIYYQNLGLDGRQIGTLLALPPLVSLFAGPSGLVWPIRPVVTVLCSQSPCSGRF
jgi:hypothetical protein